MSLSGYDESFETYGGVVFDINVPPLGTFILVPLAWLWMPWGVAIASLVALRMFRSRKNRRRLVTGHCVSCNYDLRGNVSGICPECGTETPTANMSATPS